MLIHYSHFFRSHVSIEAPNPTNHVARHSLSHCQVQSRVTLMIDHEARYGFFSPLISTVVIEKVYTPPPLADSSYSFTTSKFEELSPSCRVNFSRKRVSPTAVRISRSRHSKAQWSSNLLILGSNSSDRVETETNTRKHSPVTLGLVRLNYPPFSTLGLQSSPGWW